MKLDVRGISCPEPLIRLKKALQTEKELTLLIDSKGVLQNCEAYAIKQGFEVEVESKDCEYVVKVRRLGD